MSKRMIGLAVLLMALCLGVTAQAGNALSARKQVESSLLVSGSIVLLTDGSVQSYELDPNVNLTPMLVGFIGDAIVRWRFEPFRMDGSVVSGRVPMSLRLVARQAEDGKFSVSIVSSHFGNKNELPVTDRLQPSGKLAPPEYPKTALRMNGKGTVYLIVKVGQDGAVMDVDAEQVNLRVVGKTHDMDFLRRQFAEAAIVAAKHWTFIPPTTGRGANAGSWLARVPVAFLITGETSRMPGEWDAYVPGPRTVIPWAREQLRTAGSPDALSEGGVYPLEQGAELLPSPAT